MAKRQRPCTPAFRPCGLLDAGFWILALRSNANMDCVLKPGVRRICISVGFVPVRRPGKLPAPTHAQDCAPEYGSDLLEVHVDAVARGARVLIGDGVLATVGTVAAVLALECG